MKRTIRTDGLMMDTHDMDRTRTDDYYLKLTTSTRFQDRAILPTTSDLRLNDGVRIHRFYYRTYGQCFGYAAHGLLSPYVNDIILETSSSFVLPVLHGDRSFTNNVRLSSTRVYSPRTIVLPKVPTSPYELPAICV